MRKEQTRSSADRSLRWLAHRKHLSAQRERAPIDLAVDALREACVNSAASHPFLIRRVKLQ